MNKPCEHCPDASKHMQGYFKCKEPCEIAKKCYEADKELLELLGKENEK